MNDIILPEIVAAGIYDARLVFKNRTLTPTRTTTMFELELPLEDGGRSFIDDFSHEIREDVVICAKPGQRRHTRLPFRCYYVHIIVKEGALLDILSSLPDYLDVSDTAEMREIFISIIDHYSRGEQSGDLMLQSLILKLIYTLDKHARSIRGTYLQKPSNRGIIEDTIRYIKENMTEELSLASLSKRASFTPVYFHRLFRASTGKNLRDYVEEIRIKRSVELLLSTDKTLTEIAYECGFSSQSYFSYAFKKRMDVPPREYARRLQMKYEEKQ